jgi:hypothetical protein
MNANVEKCKGGTETFPQVANTIRRLSNGTNQSYTFIPVDYIKFEIIGIDAESVLNNPNLTFTPTLIGFDEVVNYYSVVDGMKMKVSIPSNRITLSGSIHKFWNGGIHNHNDFDENAFRDATNRMYSIFQVTPQQLRILSMEYGVNLNIDYSIKNLLNNCFQHKGEDVEVKISNDGGKFHQAKHDRYSLKLYDKGKQYGLIGQNVFRVEVKEFNWSPFRKIGIVTLEDFIQYDKTIFIQNLIVQWMNVILFDFTAPTELIKPEYINANYWRNQRDKVRTKDLSRSSFHRHWNKLKKFNATHGDDIQNRIAKSIIQKIDQLQRVTFSTFSEESKIGIRVCPITGIEINDQKSNSFLLSHSTLFKLICDQPNTFEELRRRFLSSKWTNQDIKIQVREIAHNIRNTFFNSLNRTKKIERTGQLRFEFQL